MKKTINNITINFEEEAINYIDEVFNYLLSKTSKIYSFFELYPQNKINIIIIPTKKELDTKYWNNPNKKPEDWVVGFTNYYEKNLELFLLSFNDYKNTPHKYETLDDYKRTLVHEFVHIINTLLCNENYPPDFIWEGVATYLSEQYPQTEKITESKENILNCNCDFNQLSSLFEQLINNYSKDEVIKILKNEVDQEQLINDLLSISKYKD